MVTILLGAIVACLFAVAFAGAAAVYILGWQPSLTSGSKGSRRRTMIAGTHRDAVFGTVIALLCVMTAGEYYLYAAAAKESVAWTPVLLIVEAAVFAFCFARFHKEFGISSISP